MIKLFRIILLTCISRYLANGQLAKESEARYRDNSSLYRLPNKISPEFYDILLFTNVTTGNFIYEGELTLELRVNEQTNKVVLHSEKLTIISEKTRLRKKGSGHAYRLVKIENQHYDNETQFYTVDLFESIGPGAYSLTLHFIGEVLDDLFGFYRISYRVYNETRWIGVTQFSPTYARRAFPCMDEPAFKASFQLRIGHYGNETVSSNTFQESRIATDRPNYYITSFARTPRMSTYLVGWAIHSFNRLNSSDPRFWLWTRFEDTKISDSLAASPLLIEGPKIYSTLEEWTTMSNPVNKVEQFAVPDFYFHAMENWGFITYRESVPLTLYDSMPLADVHDNLLTMSHEYAHTWFGNIVTPEFWNYAWLKEGFATYFAYLAISIAHQDWRVMDLFPLEVLQISLLLDSENHNRTMNGRRVGSPKSIKAAMDFITYKKGASIIRMISDIVGENSFQDAMRSYLREKQFKAATPSDVYEHLEIALKSNARSIILPVSIDKIIESWTTQTNYPLVRASRLDPKRVRVSQEPFQLNRTNVAQDDPRFWWIPLKIMTRSKTNERWIIETWSTWLGSNKSVDVELALSASNNDDWFLLNPQQIGYYRVNYDAQNWKAITRLLKSNEFRILPAVNRAALVDDIFNLARAAYEKYELAFELARYLSQEDEYEPWVAASRAFLLLNSKMKSNSYALTAFRRYAINLITPIYKELSIKKHPKNTRMKIMMQNLILSTACSLNLGSCVSSAKSIFENWITHGNKPVPGDYKSFVYRVGIINGTDDDWMKLWQKFLKTNNHSEKTYMIKALACTKNVSFINKYLQFSIDPESDVPKQYRLSIIQAIIACNSENVDVALNYVERNLKRIIDVRGITFLESVFSTFGEEITTAAQENKFSLFIDNIANSLANALGAAKSATIKAKSTVKWIDECASQIIKYLN